MVLEFNYKMYGEPCFVKVIRFSKYISQSMDGGIGNSHPADGGEVEYDIFSDEGKKINLEVNQYHDEEICYKALTELDPSFF